jgi:anaphase-promoting complex subunit 11
MEVISINSVKPILIWKWKFINDTCAICQHSLMGPSSKCISVGNTIDTCAPVKGQCNHVFHTDCMNDWIKNTYRAKCPLCMSRWKVLKYDYSQVKSDKQECVKEHIDEGTIDGLAGAGGRL